MSIRKEDKESDLGYRFIPAHYPQSIGHPKLEIKILCAPSEQHFDPKIVQMPIFTSIDSAHPHQIEQLRLYHPWVYQHEYRLAPGLMTLSDRKDKTVKVYTFGGSMTIDSGESCTTCRIQSDAPIIEVTQARPAVLRFVEEVEIILAERRVAWAEDITDFEVRLEKVSVSVLYAVILKKLREKFDVEQGGASMAGRDFVEVIEGEIDHLESIGHWPEDVPSVSDIL
jgi:hypothetical protein